ncbi:hypothetical protein ARMSODRAFT_983621 [Armillaria solidipes]|uniref:CCHC-type domain-containing protein n=1 Tax=Armillaria solidipes TaxID=1076256 RepID=A0A2H3AUY1_9AGAR|nr:hypothetical protein ARMSODRAFT_983621 [Armillaria solidipes]
MGDEAPWIGCKPDLIRKPHPFKGDVDDIDRFLTNCEMYFQVHSAYMWLNPHRVAFASSHFEDRAKEWWILELADLHSRTRGKFHFPSWYTFTKAIEEKFKDPAVEDINKAKMYEDWKQHIITMNRERQRKQVQDTVVGIYQPRTSQHAGASKGSSGMTSGTADKKTATSITYGGRGQAMDVDTMRAAGECFQCHKKGHISKNCPLQSWNKGKKEEVRASTTTTHIEEVKDATKK